MRKEDVPQDSALYEQQNAVSYAVDDDGRYVLTPTSGWDAANLANFQAWELIAEEMEAALEQIRAGQASPLLFHMVRNQMDVALLALYVKLPRWRVRRHLKAKAYAGLKIELRRRYATVFKMSEQELDRLPQKIELPVDAQDLDRE